jgi:hypothetical protein
MYIGAIRTGITYPKVSVQSTVKGKYRDKLVEIV